ncbi:hypothetical protein GCM10027396_19160 [Insolitispirillum peregrinum]
MVSSAALADETDSIEAAASRPRPKERMNFMECPPFETLRKTGGIRQKSGQSGYPPDMEGFSIFLAGETGAKRDAGDGIVFMSGLKNIQMS